MSVHPFVYLNPRPVHSSWFVVRKVQWNQRTCRYPSRLFVDFQYRRNHGDDDKLWQLSVCHYLRSAPVFPLETKRPLHRRCQRMYTHEKIAKASNKENWKLIDVISKEKRKRIFSFFLFFFLYAFVFLLTFKKLETSPDMIARLGSSRPEKSRGRYFKSPSFIVFLFYIFFFPFFFLRCCWWFVVVAPKKKKNSKGRCFDTCHTHTHDRPRVGGTGRPAFGGQYDL